MMRRLAANEDSIQAACSLLKAGGIVAFPTDTVYGLGANPRSIQAIEALFVAKGRPETRPIAVLIAGSEQASDVAEIDPRLERCAERFWPGPLTIVLKARGSLPAVLLAGGHTVGLRVPAHPVALGLLNAFGPIATTSANRSGDPDSFDADAVVEAMASACPLVIDGGRTPGSQASTVLDLSVTPPIVRRKGMIAPEALEEALGSRVRRCG